MKNTKIVILLIFTLSINILNSQIIDYNDIPSILKKLDKIPSEGNYELYSNSVKQQIQEAIDQCSSALALNLDSVLLSEFYYHRGRLYLKKRSIDSSKSDLETSLNLNIKNNNAIERLIVLSYHLKNYKNRKIYINSNVSAWETEVKKDSSNADNWYSLAESSEYKRLYNLANNSDKIIYYYKKCLSLDSSNHYYFYKYSLNVEGKEKEYALKKAIHLNDIYYYHSHLLAYYAYNLKRYDFALSYSDSLIERYLKIVPINYFDISNLYYFKKEIYLIQKRTKEYKEAFDLYKHYLILIKD